MSIHRPKRFPPESRYWHGHWHNWRYKLGWLGSTSGSPQRAKLGASLRSTPAIPRTSKPKHMNDPIVRSQSYGKSLVRLSRIRRDANRHEFIELTVWIELGGDFETSYSAVDNTL